ncbi:MAG: methylenetetrahydromethanopterin dehydrogenase [Nitrospinota bacterium]|nr:methylenetetrahydromethanopterin dehydrogenase [Nitrospinota bacterium]MDH5677941.1 methylenetetrahydromethanopterin dehydrogenase [Nitrospinota bacterium]MDH5756670.1 methylenetetrahydromethanopterin dehydrogenase [Nitrospinota bacterium]
MKNHLFFFSTDAHPSPFDINIALDSGFDTVIPYGAVKLEETEGLTHDIIFSRGPKGAKLSAIFVGGSDVDLASTIAEKAASSMTPPFVVPVFADPKGAYSTGAALVAKVKKAVGGFTGKRALIFGGTGPVGKVTAELIASEGGQAVIVTSRSREAARTVAETVAGRSGGQVEGESATTMEERLALMRTADIAISTVKAGVQVLSLAGLEALGKQIVVADVNAVPPAGIEGLAPHDDMKQIAPKVTGIGALAIGVVKYKVEAGLFRALLEHGTSAGYKECYELAKTLA